MRSLLVILALTFTLSANVKGQNDCHVIVQISESQSKEMGIRSYFNTHKSISLEYYCGESGFAVFTINESPLSDDGDFRMLITNELKKAGVSSPVIVKVKIIGSSSNKC
ncbi:MAG: hypothetical protein MRY83_23690 [Flavobacteriales bacterium]|nr:hypothetical protein [Flavobacteriales bacterium]